MTEPCVSELQIDRLLAGELAPPQAEQTRGHATGCPRCRELLRSAEAIARQFAERPPGLRLAGRHRPLAIGLASAVAAAIAIAVAWPPGDATGVQTKGRAALGFFVSHRGVLRRGQTGEVVAPADRLQLVTTADRSGWIAVTGVDGSGARATYSAPRPVASGRDRALPFSIILDDTPGASTITAVFCPGPFSIEQPAEDCTSDAFTIETRR
jgi:anti-sigma factor RsiW